MNNRNLNTADAQLERILYILPAACQPGGTTFAALAEALGVPESTVRRDIEEITAREFYHPAGSIDAFGVFFDTERVEVNARNEYRRPVRLNADEGLAVELGLRVLALECDDAKRERIEALGRRIQNELVAADVTQGSAVRPTSHKSDVEYDRDAEAHLMLSLGDDEVRGIISDAINLQRTCVVSYLKPGSAAPADRRISPQRLIYSDGFWYALAYDYDRRDTRFFRLDRVLNATIEDTPGEALRELEWEMKAPGTAYLADDDRAVQVRYAPNIARWIAERTTTDVCDDGCVVVQHRVADPRWIVRHVLQYAGDAVVQDDEYGELVRAAASRIAVGVH